MPTILSTVKFRLFVLQKEIIQFLLLIFALFTIYIYTLLPGPGFSGDTSKFQFLGVILGAGHEPGEPLYVLLTSIFGYLIPFNSIAWKINLFSSVAAVVALGGLYFLLLRISVSQITAWSFTLITGLLYTFWSQAVIAEVYTLNACFVIWVLYFFIRWEKTKEINSFYLATYLYALSFGNHITMITFLPSLLIFVFLVDRQIFLNFKTLGTVLFFIGIGMSQYGYVIHRYYSAPPGIYLEMAAGDIGTFLYYAFGGQFSQRLFPVNYLFLLIDQLSNIGKYILRELHFFIPVFLYGVYKFSTRNITITWLLVLSLIGNMFFASGYIIFDIYVYLIPTYLIAMIFAAIGFDSIVQRIPKKSYVLFVLFVIFFALLTLNYPLVTQSENTTVDRKTDEMLRIVDRDAIIYCPDYTYAMTFYYKHYCEGWRGKNINVLFSHDLFSFEYPFKQYLNRKQSIPLTVTRQNIQPGLRMFVFTGGNTQYQKHAAFIPKEFEVEIQENIERGRNSILKNGEKAGFQMSKIMEDLYEIRLQ